MERKYQQTICINVGGKKTSHTFTVRDGASIRVLAPLKKTSDLENISGMENGDIVLCEDTGALHMYGLVNPCTDPEDDVYAWCEVGVVAATLPNIIEKIAELEKRVSMLEKV